MTPATAVSMDLDGPEFQRQLNARSYLRGFAFAHHMIVNLHYAAETLLRGMRIDADVWAESPWTRGYVDGVLSALGA